MDGMRRVRRVPAEAGVPWSACPRIHGALHVEEVHSRGSLESVTYAECKAHGLPPTSLVWRMWATAIGTAVHAILVDAVSVRGRSNVVDFGSFVVLGRRSLIPQGRLTQGLCGEEFCSYL